MTTHNQRINHQPAFLLSTSPWRESSLLVELFTRDHGRVAMIARSARKRQSELRGVLVPFTPLLVSWFGSAELKTLHRAEWLGGWPQPQGQALFSGLYVNELVQKLTAREDPMPTLYTALFEVMRSISQTPVHHQWAPLRYFEWTLLHALGIAPDISQDGQGQAIDADTQYWMRAEHPPISLNTVASLPPNSAESGVAIHGETLTALNQHALSSTRAQQQALRLTRLLISFRLPEGIYSRNILNEIPHYFNK